MTDPSVVLVKATPLKAVLGFMKENLSEQTRAGVIGRAGVEFPAEAKRIGGPIIASDQFPVMLVNRLIELTAAEMKEPATAIAHRIGRQGAKEASGNLLRLAMILISIPNLLRKLSPVWSQLYTHGRMVHEAHEKHSVIRLEEFPVVSATGCARITGWFEWYAQQAEKNATVTHSECRAKGAKGCRWDLRW